MLKIKIIGTYISLFLSKYFPPYRLSLMLAPAFCIDLYLNDYKPSSIGTLLSFFCIIFQKHFRYEFKSRKEKCIKFFSLLKGEFSKQKHNVPMNLWELFTYPTLAKKAMAHDYQ